VIVELAVGNTVPIEIKAGMTVNADFFKGLKDWDTITEQSIGRSYIIYAGSENFIQHRTAIFSWDTVTDLADMMR
jgi:hypothetical protein